MPVAEPVESELWQQVSKFTRWPEPNEDTMGILGTSWSTAGDAFLAADAPTSPNLETGWADTAGQNYRGKETALRYAAAAAGTEMRRLGKLATDFGDDVHYAKTSIAETIRQRETMFQNLKFLLFFPDNVAREKMARQVADDITEFLKRMARRIYVRGLGGEELGRPAFRPYDENGPMAAIADLPPNRRAGTPGIVDQSAGRFSQQELKTAQKLAEEGKNVKKLQSASEAGQQNTRTGDALVDGVRTEFKNLEADSSATVKNALDKSAKGGGQAREIVLDARETGLDRATAMEGINRHIGSKGVNFDTIRIIGKDFDFIYYP